MSSTQPGKLHFIFTPDKFRIDDRGEVLNNELMKLKTNFEMNRFEALYNMGFQERPQGLDASGIFLYQLANQFLQILTNQPDLELLREEATILAEADTLDRLRESVPFTLGAEYIDNQWILNLFEELRHIFAQEIKEYDGTVALYLAEKNQHLRVPERIFFHLVESNEEEYPFAFLATYATKEETGRVRHVPLKYALTEYQNDRHKLLELLSCLNRAAEESKMIAEFVEKGELFHPLRLTAEEAYQILLDIPQIEKAGILCRIPNWWRKRQNGISAQVKLGEEQPAMLGFETLMTTRPELALDGVPLTEAEIRQLLEQTDGLAFLKGKWVEVNHTRLELLMKQMENLDGSISLMSMFRMGLQGVSEDVDLDVGPVLTNGKWLSTLLENLRSPKTIRSAVVPKSFCATLRPYQKTGYTWLNYMSKLGFGACLADDMGLGKTVQVLAFLEKMRTSNKSARALLVVPASLLGNWEKEAEKFAPKMPILILHGQSAQLLGQEVMESTAFLTVTTYGMASRINELEQITWNCLILDEAQAIKNPATKQTRQIKRLNSYMRIAMTGTPIENDLTNLWSLFDFLDKGLLGGSEEFRKYCKRLEDNPEGYAKLKGMISPFMLRRVKKDKSIISDLPDKIENVDYISMSKKQIVLYRKYVTELGERVEQVNGMERRGLILAALTKLKQICNHPDQYMGQQEYQPSDSGKFEMLREICETIYEKRERVLVFTQFKEITGYLDDFLAAIFHHRGFVLHGGTPVKKRSAMVEAFQGEDYIPYIVLSVKAGGTGLNLTNASHVIHFDRWWNPAVENQATDRAYRIGQKHTVMVHKLVCQGTIEEKIDLMIRSKTELAENVIGTGGENWITEMNNEDLMQMLKLEM